MARDRGHFGWRWLLIGTALCLALESPAAANAGTVLIWAYMGHLIGGNVLIGILEGFLIARWLKWSQRPWWVLVGANFASAWVGGTLGLTLLPPVANAVLGAEPLYRLGAMLAVMTLLLFAITLAVEAPICWFFLRKQAPWRRLWKPFFLANLVSNALLIAGFSLVSTTSLYSHFRIDRQLQPAVSEAQIYFLEPGGRTVSVMMADGSGKREVAQLSEPKTWLGFRHPDEGDGDGWDGDGWELAAHYGWFRSREPELVLEEVHGWAGAEVREKSTRSKSSIDLRPDGERRWTVYCGFWPFEGVDFLPNQSGTAALKDFQAGVEVPFAHWYSRCVSILPGDQVIYQLGPQILLLDLPTRRMRLLGLGQGPAVLLPEPPDATPVR